MGVEGYSITKIHPFDKVSTFKITKSRTRDYVTDLIKHVKDFPGPKYETAGSTLANQRVSIYKLPRITTFAEHAKLFEKLPAPG